MQSKDISPSPNERFMQKISGISPGGYPPIDPAGMHDGPDTDAMAEELLHAGIDCSGMDSHQVIQAYEQAQQQGLLY